MELRIRPIRAEDTEAALASYRAAIDALPAVEYDRAVLDDSKARTPAAFERLNRERQRLVAEIDCQVVGYAGLDIAKGEVTECFVAPGFAGKGIGSALLKSTEALAQQAGLAQVVVRAALTAVAFYRRSGYEEGAIVDVILSSGRSMRCVVMRKRLVA